MQQRLADLQYMKLFPLFRVILTRAPLLLLENNWPDLHVVKRLSENIFVLKHFPIAFLTSTQYLSQDSNPDIFKKK